MLEKLKNTLGRGKYMGAAFMDPLKTFDTINHYSPRKLSLHVPWEYYVRDLLRFCKENLKTG